MCLYKFECDVIEEKRYLSQTILDHAISKLHFSLVSMTTSFHGLDFRFKTELTFRMGKNFVELFGICDKGVFTTQELHIYVPLVG